MSLERKIEAALESYLRSEGWILDHNSGDYWATITTIEGVFQTDNEMSATINLSECAKYIALNIDAA